MLAAANGKFNGQVARAVGVHVDTVRTWRGRFAAEGMKGLDDRHTVRLDGPALVGR